MAKIFILTGEPSGDLHGANLVKALLEQSPTTEIQCWGGDRMQEAGAMVLKHVDELAFMGFIEVVENLPTILRNFKLCRKQINDFKPDLVVFMDYPGFNLRMARFVKKLGITTAYYITPQIWAWKENRAKKIKRFIDHVFVILPFEKEFFQKHGIESHYVGHPLLDEIQKVNVDSAEFKQDIGANPERPLIALLPGSRQQEIKLLLQPMAGIVERFPAYDFAVSKVAWQARQLYADLPDRVKIFEGNTYHLLKSSKAAIVTSGTATLETALIGTPEVVVYKANPLSVWLARRLVKVKFISLVNLIMDREIVKELIQQEVNTKQLCEELKKIIPGGPNREQMLADYEQLRENLGGSGASSLVANELLKITR